MLLPDNSPFHSYSNLPCTSGKKKCMMLSALRLQQTREAQEISRQVPTSSEHFQTRTKFVYRNSGQFYKGMNGWCEVPPRIATIFPRLPLLLARRKTRLPRLLSASPSRVNSSFGSFASLSLHCMRVPATLFADSTSRWIWHRRGYRSNCIGARTAI